MPIYKKPKAKQVPAVRLDSMYLEDVKFLIDRKDLDFFDDMGATEEIENEKKFKQAKGLQKLYFKNGKRTVTAMCDAGRISVFLKKGASDEEATAITPEEAEKAEKARIAEEAKKAKESEKVK